MIVDLRYPCTKHTQYLLFFHDVIPDICLAACVLFVAVLPAEQFLELGVIFRYFFRA